MTLIYISLASIVVAVTLWAFDRYFWSWVFAWIAAACALAEIGTILMGD